MKAVLLRNCMRGAMGLLILCGGHTVVLAQENAAAQAPRAVNPVVAEKLVKYAIIAIDQGNTTGNYSVLARTRNAAFPGRYIERAPVGRLRQAAQEEARHERADRC